MNRFSRATTFKTDEGDDYVQSDDRVHVDDDVHIDNNQKNASIMTIMSIYQISKTMFIN